MRTNRQVYRYERLPKPWIKRYTVFNAEQANRLPEPPEPAEKAIWDAHLEADKVLKECGVDIRHVEGTGHYYRLKTDDIVLRSGSSFRRLTSTTRRRCTRWDTPPGTRSA